MADRTNASAARVLSRLSRYTSGLAIAFGVMVLTGWTFHVQRLKGLIPGQVAVKANTAVCCILIGLALWLAIAEPKKRFTKLLSFTMALTASAIGLLSFLECRYGWDLGIDQVLFPSGPDDIPGSIRPGLMSPIAALDFLLIGIAITLVDVRGRWSHVAQCLFSATTAIAASFGILDFVLDPHTTHTHIAPLTAVILFLLSFAVLFARTEWGLSKWLVSATPAGELVRRLIPATIALPIIVGWLRWWEQQNAFFSHWIGVVIMIVSAGVLLFALTVWTASILDRIDIARTQAEASVRRLAAIVTSSNDAIIGKTLHGIVTTWNPGAQAIYGYSAEEMIGRPLNRIIPVHLRGEYQGFLHLLRQGQHVRHYETERLRKDGTRIWVSISISPVKDESGNIVGGSTIARDISDRKQAEEALRESHAWIARQNEVLNAVNSVFREAMSSKDETRLWRKCLAMAESLTGGKFGFIDELNADDRLDSLAWSDPGWEACKMPTTMAGLLPKSLPVRGIYAPVIRERQSVLTNDPPHCPGWLGLPDGHPPLTSFLGVPLKQGSTTIGIIGVGNKPGGFVASDQEDLEVLAMGVVEALMRKRAEGEVRRLNQELEQRVIERTTQLESANKELEAFTYSVSHDLRAPLRHISGFAKILNEEFSPGLPPEAQHHVQRIEEGTRRMGQLVDDLLNLGRVGRQTLNLQVTGLRSLVDDVIVSLESDIGDRGIEWHIGDLPHIDCDAGLMKQVFQNLLSNAVKFTRPREHAVVSVGQFEKDGDTILFVRDNGVGFNMKYSDKLFGVFQRLHRVEDFEGTGVGLAIVQRILHKHGGRIWAESEPDKGTSFYFTVGKGVTTDFTAKAALAGEQV